MSEINNQPERVVQEWVVFAHFPGEPLPCEGSLFLIFLPLTRTLFASLGTFLDPVRSDEQAGSLSHLASLFTPHL